jgi:hypothetical protein
MTQPLVSSVNALSAVSLSNGTPANVTSLVLGPGSWLVWATLDLALASATITALLGSLALASATITGQTGVGGAGARLAADPTAQRLFSLTSATGTESVAVGPTQVTVPASTTGATVTLYLNAQAAFSAGSVAAYGSLFALPLPS